MKAFSREPQEQSEGLKGLLMRKISLNNVNLFRGKRTERSNGKSLRIKRFLSKKIWFSY